MAEALTLVLAALPPFAAVAALLLRWPALRASVLGAGLAVALALLHPDFRTEPARLGLALVDGLVATLSAVSVVFGGMFLFMVMLHGGALRAVAERFRRLHSDPVALALLVVFGLGPFVESASGFGIAAAVGCPLLISLGFERRRASVLALLGLCTVPWGGMAVGMLLGAALTGLSAVALGQTVVWLNLPLLVVDAVVVGALAGGRSAWRQTPFAVVMVGGLTLAIWLAHGVVGVELAGVIGGLAALVLGSSWLWLSGRPGAGHSVPNQVPEPDEAAKPTPGLALAVLPYIVLVGMLLTMKFAPVLSDWAATIAVVGPGGAARWPLVTGAAGWLAVSAVVAATAYGLAPRQTVGLAVAAGRQWIRPALVTLLFVALGQSMQVAGLTARLAGALANLGGGGLVALAPAGALAGFVTSSNAGANAMLASLCAELATRLQLSPLFTLGLLTVIASHLTMASPPRLLLAVAMAGTPLPERPAEEVAVTRRMLGIGVALTTVTAAVALAAGAAFAVP